MAAQGFWMRCLCIAAKANPTGYVTVNDLPLNGQDLALLTGASVPEVEGWLSELDRNGVFSRDRKGRIYSRRMVREAKRANIARKNGKKGGNPALGKHKTISNWDNPQLKPRDKPHKPESRVHTAVAAARARDGPAAADFDQAERGSAAKSASALRRPNTDGPESRRPAERASGVSPDGLEKAIALHGRIVARLGAPLGWRGELGEVVAWLEAGYDPELDVMAAIERVSARNEGKGRPPPIQLRYFREPIAECFARRGGVGPAGPAGRGDFRRGADAPFAPTARTASIEDDPGPEEWRRLRSAFAARAGSDVEASWLARCRLVDDAGGAEAPLRGGEGRKRMVIEAPTRFIAKRLRNEFGEALEDAAAELGVEQVTVRALCAPPGAA